MQHKIKEQVISCHTSQERPFVKVGYEVVFTLPDLIKHLPELALPEHTLTLARLSNFLAKGLEFQVIEDAPKFQKMYQDKIKLEQTTYAQGARVSDYGVFDVSEIKSPNIHDEHLIYYVFNRVNHLPYKVICKVLTQHNEMSYSLLPYQRK